jgi:hypothetical protein
MGKSGIFVAKGRWISKKGTAHAKTLRRKGGGRGQRRGKEGLTQRLKDAKGEGRREEEEGRLGTERGALRERIH